MFERLEKMDRRTLASIAIAAVVGILLFGAIASGIRQAGWNEGFLVGQLSGGAQASAESGAAASPYLAARGYGMHGWGWHPFWIIGGFFRFLFFGFLIMMLFKFFAFRRWARHGGDRGGYRGGYPGGPWGHHGRHHWGHHGEEGQQGNGEQAQGTPPNNAPGDDPMPSDMNRPQQTNWTQL